jgi:hypothetical protein
VSAKEDAYRYWLWKDALYAWPRKGWMIQANLIAIADAMTVHTGYGQHCHRSDTEIGRMVGLHRRTVGRYREALTDAGLFVRTGEHKGRVQELAIVIPASAIKADGPACRLCGQATVRKHEPGLGDYTVCLACGTEQGL